VNCASLPPDLADSLLFGHRRGAFTGAVADHIGHVQRADGGTLFLDEVGELPAGTQAKLLRFLESGELQPVGESRPRRADVRFIAATNRDLLDGVSSGAFRADLYYRLHVVPLDLPPLRQRSGDVRLLLRRLTADLAGRHGLAPPRYTATATKALDRYPWPGNVRELRNFCERMVVLFAGREVEASNLPAEIRAPGLPGGSHFRLPTHGLDLGHLEQDMIRQALARTGGNRSRAARLLGLSRDTLIYRMRKYAIEA
jgi:DNA-binding NtrC family response regulator